MNAKFDDPDRTVSCVYPDCVMSVANSVMSPRDIKKTRLVALLLTASHRRVRRLEQVCRRESNYKRYLRNTSTEKLRLLLEKNFY